VALDQLPGPLPLVDFPTSLAVKLFGTCDEFSFYHWGTFNDKSKCFEYGKLVTTREIEDNLGIEVGIIPALIDNIPRKGHCENNGIWAEIAKILRSQIFDFDLHIGGPGCNVGTLSNMSCFL